MVKVAYDAGHGGFGVTPGKRTPDGEYEWDFNNVVARAFANEMKNYNNVSLLRVDDASGRTDVPLVTRTNKANNWGADVFISFHHNANTGRWGNWTGTETYYFVGSSEGQPLARVIQAAQVKAYGLRDRGIKRGNHLWILKKTNMPAVLLEGAFMDSRIDIKKMRNNTVLRNAGVETAKAVAKYYGLKRKSTASSSSNTTVSVSPKSATKTKPSTATSKSKWTKVNGKWTGQSLFQWQYGQPVTEMQTALSNNKPPFYPEKGAKNNGIDSYFGANSKNAVERFQTYYGLTVDGIPGKEVYGQIQKNKGGKPKSNTKPSTKTKAKTNTKTLPNATYYVKTPLFSGTGVRQVQGALASVYFYPEKGAKNNGVDGYYGAKTADAVKRFQSVHGLVADGIYGAKTRAKLLQVMK